MRYISTRGSAPVLDFEGVLLAGLAEDGGLYVPEEWPQLSHQALRDMRGLDYVETAFRVTWPFVRGPIDADAYRRILTESYSSFGHPAVTPLVQLDEDLWALELFHGPTLAFKDVAMQLLGRLFDHVLAKRGERITIVGATSGDTGSAAIEACQNRDNIDICILHPSGRTSEAQRRQMTTVHAKNVANVAVDGDFDACQDMVKAMFADTEFRDEVNLSAVNSINWARVMAQIVYYVYAAVRLGAPDRRVAFSVPTGNFGNVFAAYAAKQMGLPIAKLVIGSNSNDILTRFFEADDMSMRSVTPTLSPSMDIQVSSNFERLLFDLYGRNGAAVTEAMKAFRESGVLQVGANRHAAAKDMFAAARFDDQATLSGIGRWRNSSGYLLDPHSAVGVLAAEAQPVADAAMIVAATAHPAKFAGAIKEATGADPILPDRLKAVFAREERYMTLPNTLSVVQNHVRKFRNRTL
jgi:threonine synthase